MVVLKSDGAIENQSSIDEPAIVDNIVLLMEGGREAFDVGGESTTSGKTGYDEVVDWQFHGTKSKYFEEVKVHR